MSSTISTNCLQAKEGLQSQVDAISKENASLKARTEIKEAELNSALLRISAVHSRSAGLQSQLVKQSTDLDTLQHDFKESAMAKDKAVEGSLLFCLPVNGMSRCLWLRDCICQK